MTKFFIKILLFALATSMSSCVYTRMSHLSDDELAWVSDIEVGDTIPFISNRGNKSSLIIIDKWVRNSLCPFYINEGVGDGTYNASVSYYYNINQRDSSIFGIFGITRYAANGYLYTFCKLGCRATNCTKLREHDTDIENECIDDRAFYILLKANTISLNGKIYHDCVIVNHSNSECATLKYKPEDSLENQIVEYAISKEYGLLYYLLADGELFYQEIK